MKHSNNRWSLLIYALVLVTISLTMATVILSSSVRLWLNHEYVNVKNKLSRVISDNARVIFKLARSLNSNGWGFTDIISCPTNVTMSWTTSTATWKGTFSTYLYADGTVTYCLWDYFWESVIVYMDSWNVDFPLAEYKWSLINLSTSWTSKIWDTNFSDSENTNIIFSGHNSSDDIDDNANSDNYTITSTWNTLYSYNFQDDDALHRKIKFWYVTPGTGFNSIFWSNEETTDYIDNNTNNNDSLNSKIGLSQNWILYLNINKRSDIYVYEFEKQAYSDFWELKILSKTEWVIDSGEWYIQNIWDVLSLSNAELGRTDYVFDFTAKDYAILIQNTTAEVLSYNLKWYDTVIGQDLYIVPIDDSDINLLKYLWNSIIIDDEQILITEEKEVVSSK